MTRITLVLAALAVLLTTAHSVKLSTQKPLIQRNRPTMKPKARPLQDFEDGKMDEEAEEEADPVTVQPVVRDQKAATKAPPRATTKAPKPAVEEPDPNTAIYKLMDDRGQACVLFKVDAILAFKFKTIHNEDVENDLFIPNAATVTGDCGRGDNANMIISWKDFSLSILFKKTPGGERWYILTIDLYADTSNNRVFEHIKNPGQKLKLSTGSTQLLPTPVGKSHSCAQEITVDIGQGEVTAQLMLRDTRVQPFIFRNGEFGPEYVCSPGGQSFRDETAPIAVGSTFAIIVLCTITGYGAYRYFKIKKVQYDAME